MDKRKLTIDSLTERLRTISDIDGINILPALKRLNGNQNVLEIAARATGASLEKRIDKLADSLENGAIETFTTDIHGLKGSLAAIGAEARSEKAAKMETAAKAGKIDFCKENFAFFADDIKELGSKLNGIFGDSFF